MKFRYVGDADAPKKTRFMNAVDFVLGEFTEVDETLKAGKKLVVKALKGCAGFELVEDEPVKEPVIEAPEVIVDSPVEGEDLPEVPVKVKAFKGKK